MANAARQSDTKQAHEPGATEDSAQAGSSAVKLQADGKAADAAIRRMSQGANIVSDGGAATTATASVGDGGMLTGDVAVQLDGKAVTVPKGTAVSVVAVQAGGLLCKLYSSFGGKQAVVPIDSFRAEPALTHKEDPGHTDEPEDYTYQPYQSVLWNGAPQAGDVAQGQIGDCYLIAAMGAVAAANPSAIKKLFSPQTPNQSSYVVTLNLNQGDGTFSKHPVTVDTNLPSKLEAVQKQSPVYALQGNGMADHKTPIWPALVEKAYAQLMGGYDVIGQGGPPDRAMEVITGVASTTDNIPAAEPDVVAQFKQFQKAGKAVVCATLDSKQATQRSGFTGAGDGPYQMALKNDAGDEVELAKNTLNVTDKKGKAKPASDDGNNNMTGEGVTGTCSYGWGAAVTLNYTAGTGPAKPEDLLADYSWRGQLDKAINIYASHAYMFESVTADNKLVFKNPWGVENPAPMTAGDFKRLFVGISENQVPADVVVPDKNKPAPTPAK